jgi:hypothetical protein
MIMDNVKEMKLGEFAWKCKEEHCYLWNTECKRATNASNNYIVNL